MSQQKGFWLKQPHYSRQGTNSYILIHQETGFVNVKIRHITNIKFLMTQKKEMEIIDPLESKMLNSVQWYGLQTWKTSRILRQWHKRKEERKKTKSENLMDDILKVEDLNEQVLGTSRNFYSYHKMHTKWHFCWWRTHGSSCRRQKSTWIDS